MLTIHYISISMLAGCEDTQEWCQYSPDCSVDDVLRNCPKTCNDCQGEITIEKTTTPTTTTTTTKTTTTTTTATTTTTSGQFQKDFI